MKKQFIIFGIIFLSLVVGLSGCNEHMGNTINSEIQILSHNINDNEDFKSVYGAIKNIAKRDFEEVTVMVKFFDIDNVLLNTELDTVRRLAKGETGNFTVIYWYYEPDFDRYDHYTVSVSK